MYEFIYQYVVSAKYISVFILMFLLPTEAVMPIVGYMAASGYIRLLPAITIGTAGSILWATTIYALARSSDRKSSYAQIDRYGKWVGINRQNTESAGKWFDRHEGAAIFVG